MATRGQQKRSNEALLSDNGTVQNMLTSQSDPAKAKDTTTNDSQTKEGTSSTSPAVAKDGDEGTNKESPANAKDDSGREIGSKNPVKTKDSGKESEERGLNPAAAKDSGSVRTENLVSSSYLATLGSIAPKRTNDHDKEDPEEEQRQLIADKQATLNKAMKAAAEGNAEEASFLFRLHSRMVIPMPVKKDTTAKIISKVIDIVEDKDEMPDTALELKIAVDDEQPFVGNGVTFMPGCVPSVTTSLLTPYFDKNTREFKGPMPLSIFDLGWQALADSYHAEKKVKTDDVKHNDYTGYPYPDDLTLDCGAWCINYRNFLKTFETPYGWHRFAKWGAVHRENVETIRETSGWMVALRYDVKIRDSVFRMKCLNGDKEGTPDIRKHRKDVEEICYSEARRFNELGYWMENPYAKGGDREGWNPRNGEPKHQITKQHQSSFKTAINSFTTNFASTSSSGRGAHGGRGGGGGRGGRSSYRGPPEHFDPHFAEKKAAAAAAAKAKSTAL